MRERKSHTVRRVASARYAALSNGGGVGGTPPSRPDRGNPRVPSTPVRPGWGAPPTVQTWPGGYPGYPPHPDLGCGTPSRPAMGYPPVPTLDGVPPLRGVD